MRILIDTNVFLDYFLEREGQFLDAENLFRNCYKHKHQIYVTSISLRDIGYVIQRTTHNAKKAKEFQMATYQICSKVIGISSDDAIESLYSDMSDYEDSLQVEAAKSEMLDLIVSDNVKDFRASNFPVISPKDFNSIVEKMYS